MEQKDSEQYAENLATQLRKGFLAYCVLLVCRTSRYTSDIIKTLSDAELVVAEGTIYPLLSRLQKDGLLEHEWQESEQVVTILNQKITDLNKTLKKL